MCPNFIKKEDGPELKGTSKAGPSGSPLVTIVTVVLNRAATLERTIRSVLGQTYGNIEYIIVDGGSTDGSLEIIKRYQDQIDYWESGPDAGISEAFNKGIALSTGEFIGIINADDWYEPDAVEQAVLALTKTPSDIAHGKIQRWDANEKAELVSGNHQALERDMTVNHPTVFASRHLYRSVGVFRSDFLYAMDYEWLLRAKMRGAVFSYVDRCMANMQLGGLSDLRWREALREVARAKSINLPGTFGHQGYYRFQLLKGGIRRGLDRMGLSFITRFYHANFSLVRKIVNKK
jgi:glycosyltransferase involved in cell wall biosynthesis